MTIGLRPAEPGDDDAIRRVHLSAFPTAAEAQLVKRLGEAGDLVVSLVAERESEIVGHVALSRMTAGAGEQAYRALALGPLAVDRGMRGSGIGSALVNGALAIARAIGEELIFVLGEPEYYRRFGFSEETARPFASPYSGPYFMALALQPGISAGDRARADHAAAFAALGLSE